MSWDHVKQVWVNGRQTHVPERATVKDIWEAAGEAVPASGRVPVKFDRSGRGMVLSQNTPVPVEDGDFFDDHPDARYGIGS